MRNGYNSIAENQTIWLKMGGRFEEIFFQRKKKVLSTTDHQQDVNQNHNGCYLLPVRMAVIKKTRANRCS